MQVRVEVPVFGELSPGARTLLLAELVQLACQDYMRRFSEK